jgi:uncharacterized repeat protein (TIGR03803 family)
MKGTIVIDLNHSRNLAARPRVGCFPVLSRRAGLRFVTALTSVCAGVMLFWASAEAVDRQVLRGHVPPAVAKLNLQPVGRLPATNRLYLAIGLPLRNTNDLARLLRENYDPASPQFRHYLTPEQFTERFGPSQDDYEALKRFVVHHGLEVAATHPNRVILDVAGQVSEVEKAFNIKMRLYQHPTEPRKFYAPDVEPSVEAELAVLDISGLNNYALPRSLSHFGSPSPAPHAFGGSGMGGSFVGKDFRNAYAPGVTLDGSGQMLGLVEFEAYLASDITMYEGIAHLPQVPLENVLLDGFDLSSQPPGDEAGSDIEFAIAMAPGLAKVVIFDAGPNGLWSDVLNSIAANPQIKQVSSSWYDFPHDATSGQILQQIALQGQSYFAASGDFFAQNGGLSEYSAWPLDNPYVTSVGGTSLTMNGTGASYAGETVWTDGSYYGSGGGVSENYPIPSWQLGLDMSANHGSTKMRNFPDVAAVAENFLGVINGNTLTGGIGTSFAAPLWAAFTALVNQEAAANGEPAVGFLNPALYALGRSSNYTNLFHDITTGNTATPQDPTQYPAVPGYDLCTGWGSPMGSNLINALALPLRLEITPGPALVFAGSVGGTVNPAMLTFNLTNRANSLVWIVGQDLAWLNVSPTFGSLVAGGPATTVSVAPNLLASDLAVGTYTADLFFTNLSDQTIQRRQVTLEMAGLPVITSQPASAAVSEGMTASFTVSLATNALLAYQWQLTNGSSLTDLVDGAGISGSTTGTLTISNVSLTNAGTYSVIVSNLAGAVSSVGASLIVLTGQPPVVISQASSQTVLPGAPAAFTVMAAGDPPFSYFWQLNGTNLTDGGGISGSASNTLTLSPTTDVSAGNYSVLITNSFGSVTSAVAVLNVTAVTKAGVRLETLYLFNTNAFGENPWAGLLLANDGNFYGTASRGGIGSSGAGTVFRFTTNGVISLVHYFTGGSDGDVPQSELIQGTNGLLYGTTSSGTSLYGGTVFKMTTNGVTTSYPLNPASSGEQPAAGLVQGADGNFYGTASFGGIYQDGTVFRLPASGALSVLHSFKGVDGAYPYGSLVQGADGDFYGTTSYGGANESGTLFKITPAGTLTVLFSFATTNGASPEAGLTLDMAGNFYGTTGSGGTSNVGTVFKLAADGTFTSLYSFTGGDDGGYPYGGLLLASDGNLYGTTGDYGTFGYGTVFRISPEGDLLTLASFDGYQGADSRSALVQGTDGSLYGTTQDGGANFDSFSLGSGYGVIYRLSIDSPLQITRQPRAVTAFAGDTISFDVAVLGSLPVSYQWQQYGTNLYDGANISGSSSSVLTLGNVTPADMAPYSVVVSNIYGSITSSVAALQIMIAPPAIVTGPASQTVLTGTTVSFEVQATGDAPLSYQWQENGTNLADGVNLSGSSTPTLTLASVTAANAGIYSVVVSNALNSVSSGGAVLTVLPITAPGASLGILHSFNTDSNSCNPYAGVVQAADGNFYGTSLNGGSQQYGTVFKLSSAGALSVLHSFTNGPDGVTPYAGLIQGTDGNLYGASFQGVSSFYGTIFKLKTSGAFSPLYSFGGVPDGGNAIGSLIQGSDGKLYGSASTGGSNGFGAVFSLTTNGVFAPLWSFGSSDGNFPAGPLLQASDGKLYGTTALGGSNNLGTVFSISTNGEFASLASFDYARGAFPSNGLIQAVDGSLYGTASAGGTNGGWGTVFRLTTDGTLTALHSFNYQDGAVAVGGLVQGADGNLYGATSQGGTAGLGTVFQITTNGQLTTLVRFNGTNGANPQSSLIRARDGSFYGTTEFGGTNYSGAVGTGDGLVFRLTLPMFLRNPFTEVVAIASAPYGANLSTNAIHPTGDALTFAKVSGPAWLSVAADGTLSGTPALADIGANVFTVSLADTNGWSSSATMTITVVPAPLLASLSVSQGTNLVLIWSGGQPPYQVQTANDLLNPAWQAIGGPMTNTTLRLAPTNAAAFYRIQGQ